MIDKCNYCPADFSMAIIDEEGEVFAYFNDYAYGLALCDNIYCEFGKCFYIIPLKYVGRDS